MGVRAPTKTPARTRPTGATASAQRASRGSQLTNDDCHDCHDETPHRRTSKYIRREIKMSRPSGAGPKGRPPNA